MVKRLHLLLLQVFQRLPRRLRVWAVHRLVPTFTVGAVCVVEREDGAYLLLRHSYKEGWGFPGGLLKRGEEVHEGAHREPLEEVGLLVELLGEPSVVVEPDTRRVDVVYRARPAPGAELDTVRPRSPEVVETGWFGPDHLPQLSPEARDALAALRRGGRPSRRG